MSRQKQSLCAAIKGGCARLPGCLAARRWLLPAACYALALVLFLGIGAVQWASDTASRATGQLVTRSLTLADLQLLNAEAAGDMVLVSTSDDPQLLYGPTDTQLKSLTVQVQYNMPPLEVCLYYTTAPGEPFGQHKRVWPIPNADGSIGFELPGGVCAIRLDPGSRTNLQMEFEAITLNAPRTAASWFAPDGGDRFALLVLPGLAAAVLDWALGLQGGKSSEKQKREEQP